MKEKEKEKEKRSESRRSSSRTTALTDVEPFVKSCHSFLYLPFFKTRFNKRHQLSMYVCTEVRAFKITKFSMSKSAKIQHTACDN